MDDLSCFTYETRSTESPPEPRETKEREPVLNQRNKMKTAGDCNSLSGSRRQLPVHQARHGISKRRRSSHATQRPPPRDMRMISEDLEQMKLTEACNLPAKDSQPLTGHIDDPSTDGPKLHDGTSEGEDMCIDIPPSNIVSEGANGSGARSCDTTICAEDGVVGDFLIGAEIEADNAPVVNAGAQIDDNSNLDPSTASAQLSGEYVLTDASVRSGDPGNGPIASLERIQGWSPPPGIMSFSQDPNSPPSMRRSSSHLQDQHGRLLNLRLEDLNRMFPSQDNHTLKEDDMHIGEKPANTTAMSSVVPSGQFIADLIQRNASWTLSGGHIE